MGFESYFLIVWDFVKYAKDNDIAVGPGRGSAAGSIVSYVLRITDVDPLASNLLFERFLNPERNSMPDIDIDFSIRGRDRVIRYVQDKYGKDSVAQIITFGKMKPRAATRDAARVLGLDYATGDRLAKLIPEPIMGRSPSFEECMAAGSELRKAYDSEPQAQQIVDVARGLEDIVRNNSIHAAAVVIADRPLTEIVPLQLAEDRGGGGGRTATSRTATGKPERVYKTVTQYSMGPIEEIGLLKMDFLGLRTLDVLESAVAIIERSGGERDRPHEPAAGRPQDLRHAGPRRVRGRVPARVRGHAGGAEEGGPDRVRRHRRAGRPLPPGADALHPGLRARQARPLLGRYLDDRLRSITESTYGIALYQEQLMQIARDIAGFPGPKADTLRAAIGKKKRDLMASLKPEFIAGCNASGTTSSVGNQLWALMESAADYSFNRSHAACYALIAYRTAYLKANYPAEYMAALISSVMSTKDKVPFFVSRCEDMGIDVLPPDVNQSGHDFVVVEGDIRFGLDAVKNVGYAAVEKIVEARDVGRRLHLDLGLLRARGLPHREQEGDREPDQVRRARLDRGDPQGDAVRAAAGPGLGGEGAGGCAVGPGLDLRPRPRRRELRRHRQQRRIIRPCRRMSSSASSCSRSKRRRSASSSPATRWRRSATCCASAPTARSPRWRPARMAHG